MISFYPWWRITWPPEWSSPLPCLRLNYIMISWQVIILFSNCLQKTKKTKAIASLPWKIVATPFQWRMSSFVVPKNRQIFITWKSLSKTRKLVKTKNCVHQRIKKKKKKLNTKPTWSKRRMLWKKRNSGVSKKELMLEAPLTTNNKNEIYLTTMDGWIELSDYFYEALYCYSFKEIASNNKN